MKTDLTYRSVQLCRLIKGLSYKQLDYWARIGFIKPSVLEAQGTGTWRLYSEEDRSRLAMTVSLLRVGFSLQSIRRATREDFWVGVNAMRAQVFRVLDKQAEMAP